MWLMTMLVLTESYKSNLMSLLAVRYIKEPYHSFREILDDKSAVLVLFSNTVFTQILTDAKSGIFKEVADAGKQGRIIEIPTQGYIPVVDKFVSQGKYVFNGPYLMMRLFLTQDYMEKGNCKFYVSREKVLPFIYALAVQKHSPLRAALNKRIQALIEGGFYNFWLEQVFPNAGMCKNPPRKMTVKSALNFMTLSGTFFILLVGYVFGFLSLCFEIVLSKLSKQLIRE
ncbi:uncharacterized protein LOC135214621 [Macrobrachium nipponense]|uniref:uncharacterized protein LOC135214621 n=1 Tax=Macrobrachium nipponense TaxID=159736 RepID=UPI0030C80274